MVEHLAIFKKSGKRFEIEVDPDLAMELREGKDVSISEVLKAESIFSEAKKGYIANDSDLNEIFSTTNVLEIAERIVKEGEVQVSQVYREKKRSQKKKEIIEIIHRNAVDPTTDLPHPQTRIENALNECKFCVDEHKSSKEQLDEVIKKLRTILPLRIESKVLEINIPTEYAGKCASVLKGIGKSKSENWNNDGSLLVQIEIPAGIELEVYDQINSITHGNAEINVIETKR